MVGKNSAFGIGKLMRISIILLPIVCVISAGCVGDVSLHRYDNPAIRTLQEEETARHVSDDLTRAAMAGHIGERVSLLFVGTAEEAANSSGKFPPGGRAVALTSDGYFLTAYHVVKRAQFYIEKSEMIRRPPTFFQSADIDRYFSISRYSGRLVWGDPSLDLAILKFPVTGWAHFSDLKVPPQRGDTVFTADDQGSSFVPTDEEGRALSENAVGNGGFFAAGEVLGAIILDPEFKSLKISATLVARGGMSGAPLVTADHELCGIISRGEGLGPFQTPRTIASMVELSAISDIIESDRVAGQSNKAKQTKR